MPPQGIQTTGQKKPLTILGRAVKYRKPWSPVALVAMFSVVYGGRNYLGAHYNNPAVNRTQFVDNGNGN